jgi:hypothetical protein
VLRNTAVIIMKCLEKNPDRRPTMERVAQVYADCARVDLGNFSPPSLVCGSAIRAARECFCQANELSHLADFFRERFSREFLAHLQFHIAGSFNLYRCNRFSK